MSEKPDLSLTNIPPTIAMVSKTEIRLLERAFDCMGDVVFCTKDDEGRYTSVNQAFVARVNAEDKSELIGKTPADLFPKFLAVGFLAQDQSVLKQGIEIVDQLEQVTNVDGSLGWYLASKFSIQEKNGMIVGLVGISQDLYSPSDRDLEMANLKSIVDQIRDNLETPQRTEQLASSISLSSEQLDRRMKRVFRLSTKKFIMKCRLEEASRLLVKTDLSLVGVAGACGFADQSSFSKQFRNATNITPLAYRKQNQSE